jgi:hypothetical protein
MSLAEKAILANVHIAQWTGRRLDKQATETVETRHSTERGAGNYTKKLLPHAKELAEVSRLAGALRVFFYEQTLPWYSDGSRILSSRNYVDFAKEFGKRKAEYETAVSVFLHAYPDLKERARLQLGDLFRESEYPSMGYLVNAFKCEVSYMPVPDVADFRVQVSDAEKAAFLDRMREVEQNAMKECWKRLYDVVSRAAHTLSAPDAIFRDSLVNNITDICTLLPKLNVTDDPTLETMRREVERMAAGISPDACRVSPVSRQDAVKKLDDITSKMSAFMGVQS